MNNSFRVVELRAAEEYFLFASLSFSTHVAKRSASCQVAANEYHWLPVARNVILLCKLVEAILCI